MKKLSTLLLATLMVGGIAFVTGCGEKSDADKAADAVEDAGKQASDAIKDATK